MLYVAPSGGGGGSANQVHLIAGVYTWDCNMFWGLLTYGDCH